MSQADAENRAGGLAPDQPAGARDGVRLDGEFLAHVRHELRTPMNHIIGYTEMLLEEAEDLGEGDVTSELRQIHVAARLLLSTIDSGFRAEAIRYGHRDFDRLGHELRTPLTQIIGYAELLLGKSGAGVPESFTPDLDKILTAGRQLAVLIDNALDLGRLEGGDPDTESAALRLQAYEDAAAGIDSEAGGAALRATDAGTDRGVLLVVDDDKTSRDLLSRRLERNGYVVHEAENGRRALELVESVEPDLVLLDIMMPDISGLEVLKTIREGRNAAELPVIMTTGRDKTADMVRALSSGASDYVKKPLEFDVVLARIRTQLLLKRAVAEIQQLNEGLSLRNRFIRKVFGRYVSDSVVASLLETPKGLKFGGEKRVVTILMSDLRGFSSLSERLTPEQVVALLNIYLGAMAEVVMEYEGTIDEFVGDAVLAVFGAPVPRPDHAARAVACALSMQMAMGEVNARNRERGLPDVEMGIGVHTGEVVVGNIGSDKRAKYGVVGNPVNLTARIESYTVGGQILVSGTTKGAAGPSVMVGDEMEVQPKGTETPIKIHDVVGIGEPYNLEYALAEDALCPLRDELPVRFTVLDDKLVAEQAHEARFAALSSRGAEMHTDAPVDPFTNIKIRVLDADGAPIPGDVYAKALEGDPTAPTVLPVRFTSLHPDLRGYLDDLPRQS